MDSGELTVFVDTNGFLHLRDLKDLPWRTLFPGVSLVRVAVAAVVIDELDRHKEDPSNRRRRDRARAALRDIDAASESATEGLDLRPADPTVRLVVPFEPAIDWTQFPTLDATKADDRLVVAAASSTQTAKALLSVDSGPRIKARRLGLAAPAPPSDWRLLEQTDDPSRELAKVSEALARLQATKPTLTVEVLGLDDDEELRQRFAILPALSAPVRNQLETALKARHPKADVTPTTNLPFAAGGFLNGEITPEDVAVYAADHRSFLASEAVAFEELNVRASWTQMFVPIVVVVENTSAVTAQRLHLRLTAIGGGEIVSDWDDLVERGGAIADPEAPAPPSGHPKTFDTSKLGGPFWARDPTEFFELDSPEGHLRECAEFRAGRRVLLKAWWAPPPQPCDVEIRLTLSASNLPEPITQKIPLFLEPGDLSWKDPAVLKRLPAWMGEIIKAAD